MKMHVVGVTIAALVLVLSGCETVKGTGSAAAAAASGASQGAKKDYQNAQEFVKGLGPRVVEFDQWMRKHMW